MGISDIWLITLFVNYLYKIKTYVDTYKTYADLGYIFNNKELKLIENQVYENESNLEWFLYKFGKFIPIYNLYQSLIRNLNLCSCDIEQIENFKECGIIEKMTAEEKKEYNKNSTGLTAIKLRRRLNKRRKKYNMVMFSDGSSILFDYKDNDLEEDDLLNSIVIIESRGDFEEKSNEELIQIVCNSHIAVAESIINYFENTNDLSISTSCEEESHKPNDIKEQSPKYSSEDYSDQKEEKKSSKKRVRKR